MAWSRVHFHPFLSSPACIFVHWFISFVLDFAAVICCHCLQSVAVMPLLTNHQAIMSSNYFTNIMSWLFHSCVLCSVRQQQLWEDETTFTMVTLSWCSFYEWQLCHVQSWQCNRSLQWTLSVTSECTLTLTPWWGLGSLKLCPAASQCFGNCIIHSEVMQSLVMSLLLKCLDFSNWALAELSGNFLNMLQSLMNAVAFVIFVARKFEHITTLLCELHWICVPQWINFRPRMLAFCCWRTLPTSFIVWWTASLSIDHSPYLIPPIHHSMIVDRAFCAAAPCVWNDLPHAVISSPTLAIFQRCFLSYHDCL